MSYDEITATRIVGALLDYRLYHVVCLDKCRFAVSVYFRRPVFIFYSKASRRCNSDTKGY